MPLKFRANVLRVTAFPSTNGTKASRRPEEGEYAIEVNKIHLLGGRPRARGQRVTKTVEFTVTL